MSNTLRDLFKHPHDLPEKRRKEVVLEVVSTITGLSVMVLLAAGYMAEHQPSADDPSPAWEAIKITQVALVRLPLVLALVGLLVGVAVVLYQLFESSDLGARLVTFRPADPQAHTKLRNGSTILAALVLAIVLGGLSACLR
jgi:hypothetical protein